MSILLVFEEVGGFWQEKKSEEIDYSSSVLGFRSLMGMPVEYYIEKVFLKRLEYS